jgi:hypothetical protein
MTDEVLEAAVRREFSRQAECAPVLDDLSGRVRAGSRERRRRERALAVAVAAAATIGVLAVVRVLPIGPSGDIPPGVSASAPGSTPEPAIVAAGELTVCLVRRGAGVADLMLATRPGPGRTPDDVDTNVRRLSDGTLRLTYQEGPDTPVVRLDLPSRAGVPQDMRERGHVDVRGRDGWIGDDPAIGRRAVYFDTGVDEVLLRLSVDGDAPDDAALLDLARRIVPSADPGNCV